MTNRLTCRNANHGSIEHTSGAIVTHCVKCRKPTCSDCEGTDDGLRDICDGCAVGIHDRIDALRARGQFRAARRLARKWSARGRYRETLHDHDLDTPEAA